MTITIDDKIIEVSEEKTILDVAQEEGIYIPTLCHYKNVPDDASCMVCVVKNKESHELLPACSTYVEDGMAIETNSEEILA
ncbi:MAG: (2Fe-2S)-binding protein, partial [Bacteroidales bacterium]|nr:(2Fe-2S)-binding protein [Bacteroidales bacterium]